MVLLRDEIGEDPVNELYTEIWRIVSYQKDPPIQDSLDTPEKRKQGASWFSCRISNPIKALMFFSLQKEKINRSGACSIPFCQPLMVPFHF